MYGNPKLPITCSSRLTRFFTGFCIVFLQACDPSQPPETAVAAAEIQTQEETRRIWFRDEEIVAALELTEQQIEALTELTLSSNETSRQIRVAERKVYTVFLRTLNQKQVNQEALEAAVQRYEDTIVAQLRRQTTRLGEIRRILTHEQWFKLMEIKPRVFIINRFTPTGEPKPLTGQGVLISD